LVEADAMEKDCAKKRYSILTVHPVDFLGGETQSKMRDRNMVWELCRISDVNDVGSLTAFAFLRQVTV
jgi:hypothetical protein